MKDKDIGLSIRFIRQWKPEMAEPTPYDALVVDLLRAKLKERAEITALQRIFDEPTTSK